MGKQLTANPFLRTRRSIQESASNGLLLRLTRHLIEQRSIKYSPYNALAWTTITLRPISRRSPRSKLAHNRNTHHHPREATRWNRQHTLSRLTRPVQALCEPRAFKRDSTQIDATRTVTIRDHVFSNVLALSRELRETYRRVSSTLITALEKSPPCPSLFVMHLNHATEILRVRGGN